MSENVDLLGEPIRKRRARDIKAVHAMKRELALTDDSYRAVISRVTAGRVESSADLTPPERRQLLDELRRLGAGKKTAPPRRRAVAAVEPRPFKPANSQQQKLIRGLWLELAGFGEIKDASESALAGYVLRQAKVDALQFVTSDKAQSVIGGLRSWVKRVKKQRGLA